MTISSQGIPLAAFSLLLSQRQGFPNTQPARVPITPKQQRTMEMRFEVLSSVGAQDMGTRVYQAPDLDDVKFGWKNGQLDVNTVSTPTIDTLFSTTAFNDSEVGRSAENLILLYEEANK